MFTEIKRDTIRTGYVCTLSLRINDTTRTFRFHFYRDLLCAGVKISEVIKHSRIRGAVYIDYNTDTRDETRQSEFPSIRLDHWFIESIGFVNELHRTGKIQLAEDYLSRP